MTDLKIEREFSADPESVFAFLTGAENVSKWWGPEGMTVKGENMSFSRLGAWDSVMMNAEGGTHKVTGEVTAIDPPNPVEFTWGYLFQVFRATTANLGSLLSRGVCKHWRRPRPGSVDTLTLPGDPGPWGKVKGWGNGAHVEIRTPGLSLTKGVLYP